MRHVRETRDTTAVATDQRRGYRVTTSRCELSIRDIMTKDVVTATSDDTVYSAAKKMSDHRVSCLVIVGGELVAGILTEKDVLKAVGREQTDFRRLTVRERMSSPVEVVCPEISVLKAGEIMESKGIRRLPVVQGAQLLGIVTQTDITRGLILLSPLGCVSTIMSTHVATVQAEATVAEAARIMSSNGISCILAMHRNEVAGIVSEKDLLKRVVALHKDPISTSVAEVMSFPIKGIPPDYSILSASNEMDKLRLHRLVVMDGKHLCGIVTQTDIMRAVRSELERLQGQSQVLMTELAALAQRTGQDLEKVHDLLQKVQCASTVDREAAVE